jgi:hypothetical protein
MFGFDDAAGMGLGMANAGIQAYGASVAKRHAKKAAKVQEAERLAQYKDQQQDLDLSAIDTKRQGYMASENAESDDVERGLGRSTIASQNQTTINNTRDRRLNAIGRGKARLTRGFEAENKVKKIQRRAEKAQAMFSMIGSLMGGGLSGGAMSNVSGGGDYSGA